MILPLLVGAGIGAVGGGLYGYYYGDQSMPAWKRTLAGAGVGAAAGGITGGLAGAGAPAATAATPAVVGGTAPVAGGLGSVAAGSQAVGYGSVLAPQSLAAVSAETATAGLLGPGLSGGAGAVAGPGATGLTGLGTPVGAGPTVGQQVAHAGKTLGRYVGEHKSAVGMGMTGSAGAINAVTARNAPPESARRDDSIMTDEPTPMGGEGRTFHGRGEGRFSKSIDEWKKEEGDRFNPEGKLGRGFNHFQKPQDFYYT